MTLSSTTSPGPHGPGPARLRDAPEVLRRDPLQLLTVSVVVVAAVLTTRPESAAVLVLLAVNAALCVATRLFPLDRAEVLVAAVLACGALVAVSSNGYPTLFALFACGQAGFRLPMRQALAVAGLAEVVCVGVILLDVGGAHPDQPWWSQVPVGIPVLAGMLNRERTQALAAANEALALAGRASEAEAREKVLAERGRIARDVHDVLAHSLAAIAMQLELADALLDAGQTEKAQTATRKAQAIARDGMEQTQRTVFALREGVLPLVATVTSLCTDVGARLEVVGDERAVAADVAQALVRVVQESLANAAKHAAGAPVAVTLRFEPAGVSVETVNGAGVDSGVGGGMGLVGMRERMAGLGGRLQSGPVQSGPVQSGPVQSVGAVRVGAFGAVRWGLARARAGARVIRVVVADDQTAIREALVTVLELMPGIEVVGAAADGAEAVALAAGADVVLMDLDMPVMGGVEATRLLAEQHPGVAVVVLTTLADQEVILAALQAGARGYLTKQSGRQDIVRAIEAAAAGQAVLDPVVQLRLVAGDPRPAARALPVDLTSREVEVLSLIGQGLPNRAIGRQLFIGEATVKTHVNHLFQKLGITDREAAVALAKECGLA